MPRARFTAPVRVSVQGQLIDFAADAVIDGDTAAYLLTDPSLPLVEINESPAEAPKRRTKATDADAPVDSES